jgi:hypothetical protein
MEVQNNKGPTFLPKNNDVNLTKKNKFADPYIINLIKEMQSTMKLDHPVSNKDIETLKNKKIVFENRINMESKRLNSFSNNVRSFFDPKIRNEKKILDVRKAELQIFENTFNQLIKTNTGKTHFPKKVSLNKNISQNNEIQNKKIDKFKKNISGVTFKDKLHTKNNIKGFGLSESMIEKSSQEIERTVQKNRKSWIKKNNDLVLKKEDYTIIFIAKSNEVIVQFNEIGHGTYKTAYIAMNYDSGQLFVCTKQDTPYNNLSELKDNIHYLNDFSSKGLLDHEFPNLLIPFHVNIVQEGTRNIQYELSKLCTGGELGNYGIGSENALSYEQQYQIIKDLLTGLKTLHDRGLQHGDISPDNILLEEKGKGANLMDFDEMLLIQGGKNSQLFSKKTDIKQLGTALYHTFIGYNAELGEMDVNSNMQIRSQEKSNISNDKNYAKLKKPENPLEKLICDMLNPDVKNRPDVDEALEILNEIGLVS